MLKVLYAFFVGLLMATFVGVGVSAYYPAPEAPQYPEVLATKPHTTESPQHSEEQTDAQRVYDREYKEYQDKAEVYHRNVSIIALVAAIVFVSLSLLFERKIRVIADGVLLGGVFTLLYSIGQSFATEDSKYTFLVVSAGLAIALWLGYWRFVRPQAKGAKKKRP